MRSMPDITIFSVSDNHVAVAAARMAVALPTASYVRLDRQPLPDLYTSESEFEDGLSILREGDAVQIVATGCMTHTAMKVAEDLSKRGIEAGVVDVYRIPADPDKLLGATRSAKKIVTLEEHFLPGGFGSYILEVFNDGGLAIPVKRIGLSHLQGYSYAYGGRSCIHECYGLNAECVAGVVETFLG